MSFGAGPGRKAAGDAPRSTPPGGSPPGRILSPQPGRRAQPASSASGLWPAEDQDLMDAGAISASLDGIK